ncbi:hypothetical protein HDU97_002649 [Phlyctochytrium planicorne]|nr:hypothetical protein HDU97_002649 [Phlyctochytrium planicorne]
MSTYELEREARIRQNLELLQNLELAVPKQEMDEDASESKRKRQYQKRPKDAAALEASRLSRRLRGEEPENVRFGKSKRYKLGNEEDREELESDEDIDRAIAKQFIAELQREPIVVSVPFTLASVKLTIWDLGQVIRDPKRRELFWSQRGCRYRHQYPIGFHATKTQFGRDWTMTIEDGGNEGPRFKVESNDGHVFVGSSPTRPWTDICIQLYGKQAKTRVSGPFQFGFTDAFLQAVLASLDPMRDEEDNIPQKPITAPTHRGLRFGERKRGRPRRVTAPEARWTESALALGALQIITDVAPLEPREPETTASGRPKRQATSKPEPVETPKKVAPPKSSHTATPVKSISHSPATNGSASKAKSRSPKRNQGKDDIIHCVCRKPHEDDGRLMVSCDNCLVWYHAECVEYDTEKEQNKKKKKSRDEWFCPRCNL